MVSRGELGLGYLLAVGFGIFGAFTSGVMIPMGSGATALSANSIFATGSGLTVAAGFVLAGVGLVRSGLSGEQIWRVSTWSAIGLGLPTLLIVLVVLTENPSFQGLDWRSVAILQIAGGGIVGILAGTIAELRAAHDRTKRLNERNRVFIRLFRHDIRNSINAIVGHVELVEEACSPPTWSMDVIRDHLDQVLHLSDAARQLDDLSSAASTGAVDLEAVVVNQLEALRTSYPDADVDATVPAAVTVEADELLASVVENLLTNAVEHNDGDPAIRVAVVEEGDSVVLEVRDDGPGFSEDELAVHSSAKETALRHSSGIGLWLSRWIVDSYGGDLTVENDPAGGAVVTVRLRNAGPAT